LASHLRFSNKVLNRNDTFIETQIIPRKASATRLLAAKCRNTFLENICVSFPDKFVYNLLRKLGELMCRNTFLENICVSFPDKLAFNLLHTFGGLICSDTFLTKDLRLFNCDTILFSKYFQGNLHVSSREVQMFLKKVWRHFAANSRVALAF